MTQIDYGATGRIFISYRRGPASYPAGWLYDRLVREFDRSQVFKDVDNVQPGEDFFQKLTWAVSSCEVLLTVVGPDWATLTNAQGGRRLEDPTDLVRIEVETALERRVNVIPLLVDNARMPTAAELPASIAALSGRQAHALSPQYFDRDVDLLVVRLHQLLGSPRQGAAPVAGPGLANRADLRLPGTGQANRRGDLANGPPVATPKTRLSRYGKRAVIGLATIVTVLALMWACMPASNWLRAAEPSPSPSDLSSLPRSAEPIPNDHIILRLLTGKDWSLSVIDSSGVVITELATGEYAVGAVISRDRRTVLYRLNSDREEGPNTLRAVGADGLNDRAVFSDGTEECPTMQRPAWSSDNLLAMVCTGFDDGYKVLNILSADGDFMYPLDDETNLGDPTFTRDGKSVVYWRNDSREAGVGGPLWIAPVDQSSAPRRISGTRGANYFEPMCSPTSDEVVFTSDAGETKSIEMIDLADPDASVQVRTSGEQND